MLAEGAGAVTTGAIQTRILVIRDCQVMLDQDLAELYGVQTAALTRAVRRNTERFPADFIFQLSKEEHADLKCQLGISNGGRGGRRYPPYAFTEQGVAMLSGVLRSKRAVAVNIEIMRAFVEMRRAASLYEELEKRINDLEKKTAESLGEHGEHLAAIFCALKQLMAARRQRHPIGFSPPRDDE